MIHQIGSASKTPGGKFLLVGPEWKGRMPEDFLDVLRMPTKGIETATKTFIPWLMRQRTPGMRRAAWTSFGRWLLLGLEFMLAADVVRTVIAPTWQEIGRLGAIALIRTFLGFFLERDLAAAVREQAADAGAAPAGGSA